jgi:hypothetical protein
MKKYEDYKKENAPYDRVFRDLIHEINELKTNYQLLLIGISLVAVATIIIDRLPL